MREVCIIGGGPAGLFAGIQAARQGAQVTILEKKDRPLKKLLITGKGRCNVTNNCDADTFFANVVHGAPFLRSAYSRFGAADTMAFFEGRGLPLKTERGGRVFPVSDRAADVADTLRAAAAEAGCRVVHATADSLLLQDGSVTGVRLKDGQALPADRVLIATGGLSYPGTGSTGDGYRLARQAGHFVTPLTGSLVPLCCAEPFVRDLMGLSLKNVTLTLSQRGKPVYREQGEMLFTHFGLSGPLTLSGSAHLSWDGPVTASIDLKPALDEARLDARILRDFSVQQNKNFSNALDRLLPAKLIPVVVMRSGIPPEQKVHSITKKQRQALVTLLKQFTLTVTGPRPVEEAIVTRGGVQLKEIQPASMRSKLVNNLYFAGEVLDLDAYTGGFNLQIAFTTAYAAGNHIATEE